jgi:hypothetical protein
VEDKPGFIIPPPGLIPPAPSAPTETSETVRLGDRRPAIPVFVPAVPGITPPPTVVVPKETAAPIHTAVPLHTAVPIHTAVPTHTGAPPQWSLTMHDGSVRYVSGTLLLGRDPARVEGWASAGLMVINDPEKTISKTHAAIDCTGDQFFIVDLHSTNGVAIIAPDGTETIPDDGVRTAVAVGSDIELGRYRIVLNRQ